MGLRFPSWMWLAALAAPLILLYVLKARREEREIPSTWLWVETLQALDARVPFRRLRKDWLLLLQLLILAGLVVAAAGPFRTSLVREGARMVIVLDASASLLAGDRAREARREAARLVDGMRPRDEAAVVLAGAHPQVLASMTADRGTLRRAVSDYRAEAAPADLDSALGLARSLAGENGDVVLVTDGKGTVPEIDRLQVLRVGDALPNTSIVALGVRASDPSGFDHQVYASVRNASTGPSQGTLRLFAGEALRDAAALSLSPGEARGVTLRLVGVSEGPLEVRWDPDRPDPLPEDDRAYWFLRGGTDRVYRTAGENGPFVAHAVDSLPGWTAATPGDRVDLEIVFRDTPGQDGPPFLWIDPEELRQETVSGARVLEQDSAHPVLRHVDLRPTRFGEVPVVRRPRGTRVLARSSAGPLLLEGVRGGRRFVAWCFDPLETDLPLRVAFPVLVHNTLEHLAPPAASLPGGLPTGESPVVPWPSAGPVRLHSPSGDVRTVSPVAGLISVPALDEVGIWKIEDERHEVAFGASLLSETESDLGAAAASNAGSPSVRRASTAQRLGIQDFWKPLVVSALVLLLLEGWAFHRRWLA